MTDGFAYPTGEQTTASACNDGYGGNLLRQLATSTEGRHDK
jgi:hypothetical protein